ncbi:hypothetical protein SAMN05216371_7317 [Streptomyces sp. TLI_053]|nr:hypothetical protein SAMN05216371_7317 [Streptomyces sp. TLI_053]
MVHHQRQHQQTRLGAEEDGGHRQPGSQALLRAAEHRRDTGGAVQAEQSCAEPGGGERGCQQEQQDRQQSEQCDRRDGGPHALLDRAAERGVHDQQDRSPVDRGERPAVAAQECADPGAQQLPRHEGREQLAADPQESVGREGRVRSQQPGREERRQQQARQAGVGARADRGRDVPPGDGRQRHRGLDGGRHQAEEQHAGPQRPGVGGRRRHGEAEQGEQDEGAGQDEAVQPQVPQPGDGLPGGQPCPVEEEEQPHRELAGQLGPVRRPSGGRKQRGQCHRPGQRGYIGVEQSPPRPSSFAAAHWRARCLRRRRRAVLTDRGHSSSSSAAGDAAVPPVRPSRPGTTEVGPS